MLVYQRVYRERERDKGVVIYSGFKVKVNKTPSQPMTAWFIPQVDVVLLHGTAKKGSSSRIHNSIILSIHNGSMEVLYYYNLYIIPS